MIDIRSGVDSAGLPHVSRTPVLASSSRPIGASWRGILTNTGWLTGARICSDAVGFALFVVLSREYGPPGIGEYAYGYAVAGFAVVFVSAGLDDYGMRQYVLAKGGERMRLVGRLLAAQLALLAIVTPALAGFLVATRTSRELAAVVVSLYAYEVLAAVAQVLFVPELAEERMRGPALAELGCRLLVAGVVVGLVLAGDPPLPVVLAVFPAGGVSFLAFAARSASRHVAPRDLRPRFRGVWLVAAAAWPFGAGLLVDQLYFRADVVLLGLLRGQREAGLFASGLKFVEVGAMPIMLLGLAAYPALSRACAAGARRFATTLEGLLRLAAVAGALLAWAFAFVAPPIVAAVLGSAFDEAAHVTRALALYAPLLAVETILFRALFAAHEQKRRLAILMIAAVADLVLGLALIPRWGVWGAVCATLLAVVVLVVLSVELLRRTRPGAGAALRGLGRNAVVLGLLAAGTAGVSGFARGAWLPAVASLFALLPWAFWTATPAWDRQPRAVAP